MNLVDQIEKSQMKQTVPTFKVGDTVRVYSKIVEGGKERLYGFEGLAIKRQHGGVRTTFTVRREVQGVGVERTFLLHSPRLDRIEVIKPAEGIRRAKLYYVRKQRAG